MINNPPLPNGIAPCVTSIAAILLNMDVPPGGIKDDKLCKKMMVKPMNRIDFVEAFKSRLNMINPNPITAKTPNRKTSKCGSNQTPKVIKVNSRRINHTPLVNKNSRVLGMSFFFLNDK